MSKKLSSEGWECLGGCGVKILPPRGIVAQAPLYCEVDDRMLDDMADEDVSRMRYEMALADGLSDHEAREEGWPLGGGGA